MARLTNKAARTRVNDLLRALGAQALSDDLSYVAFATRARTLFFGINGEAMKRDEAALYVRLLAREGIKLRLVSTTASNTTR